ncbi:MAG: GNAT family N-acetyltransferase [Anaerolineaceae bacterium]|nr:GNAT family N-acetyltransferase [Anaerolineaceae bacterium]
MPESGIDIFPATAVRWPDVQVLFAQHGELGCWCQYWRHSASAYRSGGPGSGEKNLQRQVADGPPPRMVAYQNGEPAGWLGFWPRHKLDRLVRSRTIHKVDDQEVWSIVCFMVRVGYRRQGVARALLAGAIAFARDFGVQMLEAYPIDPEGNRIDVTFGYVGFTPMFEAAGFQRIVATNAHSAKRTRILMRLEVGSLTHSVQSNPTEP